MVVLSKCHRQDRVGNKKVKSTVNGRAKQCGLVRSPLYKIPHKSVHGVAILSVDKMSGQS